MKIGRQSYAIPFHDVSEAAKSMTWASENRVMFEIIAITGCRIKALDCMEYDKLHGTTLFYKPGKRQKGYIQETLPVWWVKEYMEYRKNAPIQGNQMFWISAETFRRYFNRDVRPKLIGGWIEKLLIPQGTGYREEYQYELKGLRKNYQTRHFAENLQKWKNPEIALMFTSKHMKHSTTKITAHHYLENFDALGIRPDLRNIPTATISMEGIQKRILEY